MPRRIVAGMAALGLAIITIAATHASTSAPTGQVRITVTSPTSAPLTFTIAIWSDSSGQSQAVRNARTPFERVVRGTDVRAIVLAAPGTSFNADIADMRDGKPLATSRSEGFFRGAVMLHRSPQSIGVGGF